MSALGHPSDALISIERIGSLALSGTDANASKLPFVTTAANVRVGVNESLELQAPTDRFGARTQTRSFELRQRGIATCRRSPQIKDGRLDQETSWSSNRPR
jgi:hypothetical protein